MSARTSSLVRDFRSEIDRLLEHKAIHPAPTNWDRASKEGALMNAMVELITTEEQNTVGNLRF